MALLQCEILRVGLPAFCFLFEYSAIPLWDSSILGASPYGLRILSCKMQPSAAGVESNRTTSGKKYGFEDVVYPGDYSFDFEKLLPSSYLLKDVEVDINPGYRINRATRMALAGDGESKYTDKAVVCKHWLRGLCKKGDLCEFLHEYNLKRIPECWFYTKYGECSNPECMYLHLDPESKVKYCPLYERGFCPRGPSCKERHLKRAVCKNYMLGFCEKGPKCCLAHPKCVKSKIEGPAKSPQNYLDILVQDNLQKPNQGPGFSSYNESDSFSLIPALNSAQGKVYRPLETVTCFKCGMKGHYANRCAKRARIYPTEADLAMRGTI